LIFYIALIIIAGTVQNIEKRFFKGSWVGSMIIGMALFALPLRYLNDSFYYNSISLMVFASTEGIYGLRNKIVSMVFAVLIIIFQGFLLSYFVFKALRTWWKPKVKIEEVEVDKIEK